MTRPRELQHRPGCAEPGTRTSRVGSWLIERCTECRATGVRHYNDTTTTESEAEQ